MTEAQEAAALKLAETARKRAQATERAAQKEIDKLRPWFRGSDGPVINYCNQQIARIIGGRRSDPDGGDIKLLRESRERRIRGVELRKGSA